jgi:glycosyltransferase involved in cell wall biosynthesis
MTIAREEGIPTPDTAVVSSADDVVRGLSNHGLPAVLKADGTSAGEGVVVARDLEEAVAAYHRLNRPLRAAVVAKRALIDGDSNGVSPWLHRLKQVVSMQSFISGPDANIAVACWQGRVLASISVEVLRRYSAKGPATVVRVLQDGEMLQATEKIVRRLGLSGLCGLDFMIDQKTRTAHLIEINMRATQTAHLPLGPGHDLPAALGSAISGFPIVEPEAVTRNDMIALFPLAWRTDCESEDFGHAYHDVPWEEPALVRAGVAKQSRFTQENWNRFWSQLRARRTGAVSSQRKLRESPRSKVLHLIGSNLVGGPEKQILHHATDLRGSTYEVEIGSFHDLSERPEILQAAEDAGLSTVCLKGGIRLDLVDELSEILRQRKGSLLCTHGFKANVVGYLAAKRTQTLHIAFVRGWTAETMRVKLYEVLERQALKRAQWVVCVSGKQAERLARMRKKKAAPTVIPNAMLPPYPRESKTVVTRDTLGIPKDAFIFGSVGRLSAEKGHRFLISAFHDLCTRTSATVSLSLIVVGDGREQEALEQQASQLGIRDRVVFAGYQGNIADWMRLFGCMVQPSLTEGTPNSVLEALCLQVPVIATAVGGVPDLVMHGCNGLLVPAEDATQLADAMKLVLESAELRDRLIAGGAAVKAEYSPEVQRQKLIKVYETAFRSAFPGANSGTR